MLSRTIAVAILSASFLPLGFAQSGQLNKLAELGRGGASGTNLSDTTIASGLKQALSVGAQNAVKLVDRPGGYLDNQAIKILLPKSLRAVEPALRGLGQGPKIDEFVLSMNHAAENAAPEAEHIFANAITEMSIEDARKLLSGGNTAITDYFKSQTSAQLTTAFRPHVEKAMAANGVTQQYDALVGQAPQMPFMKSSSLDINTYVVDQALNGLFYMLGQQEKDIRENPAARTTSLLKQVFGQR